MAIIRIGYSLSIIICFVTVLGCASTSSTNVDKNKIKSSLDNYVKDNKLQKVQFNLPEGIKIFESSDTLNVAYSDYLKAALTHAFRVKGTDFVSGIKVNKPYDDYYIKLYIISDDTDQVLVDLNALGGCSYAGFDNLILCDNSIFKQIEYEGKAGVVADANGTIIRNYDFSIIGYDPETGKQVQIELTDKLRRDFEALSVIKRRVLWFWIVAHEIGHIALGHSQRIATDSKLEDDADQFAFDSLDEITDEDYKKFIALQILQSASSLINRESENLYGESLLKPGSIEKILLSENKKTIIVPQRYKSHQPMLIRAAKIAHLISRKYDLEKIGENNADTFYKRILELSKVVDMTK